MTRRTRGTLLALLSLWTLAAVPPQSAAADTLLVLTADTEGHVGPCTSCPHGSGDGGLARRATAVESLRGGGGGGAILLLDAGNALFGGDSLATGGGVIVDAYDR